MANKIIQLKDGSDNLYPNIHSSQAIMLGSSVQSANIQSTRNTGWVARIVGTDSNGKAFQIGFDYSGGIYCYYDGTLVWNIRP